MLGRRALQRIGDRQYRMQGSGRDVYGEPNWWHVDLAKFPPYCDCPAFLNFPETPQTCKHIVFLQQAEKLLAMIGIGAA